MVSSHVRVAFDASVLTGRVHPARRLSVASRISSTQSPTAVVYTHPTCLPVLSSHPWHSRTFHLTRTQSNASYAQTCVQFTCRTLQFVVTSFSDTIWPSLHSTLQAHCASLNSLSDFVHTLEGLLHLIRPSLTLCWSHVELFELAVLQLGRKVASFFNW